MDYSRCRKKSPQCATRFVTLLFVLKKNTYRVFMNADPSTCYSFFSVCGLLIDRRERTITAALSPFRTIFFWSKRERLLTHTWWWWHFYWIFASTTISSKETCALCFTSSFYYCIRVFKKRLPEEREIRTRAAERAFSRSCSLSVRFTINT